MVRHAGSRGFTLLEMLLVIVIFGFLLTLVAPKIDLQKFTVDSAMQSAGTTLLVAQRLAVTRQHNIIVAFDVPAEAMRILDDANNNGQAGPGERVVVPGRAPGLETGLLMQTQRGFTLIEVMVAVVILSVVLLGTAQLTTGMVHTAATSGRQDAAIELAQSRIARIQADPNYATLEKMYVATEIGFPALPGFSRHTDVLRYGGVGQPNDYKKITVTVSGPGLLAPVSRTVTVAAP